MERHNPAHVDAPVRFRAVALAAIIGYLLGSFPAARIVGHFTGVDPTTQGDRNPGWWNMRKLAGERAAAIVLVLDVLKGALAATVGLLLWGPWWTAYVALFFALVGHAFPLFAGFRGGRSILTWAGGMLIISPVACLISLAIGAVFGGISKKLSVFALVSAFVSPLVQAFFDPRAEVAANGVLMTFIGLRFLSAFLMNSDVLARSSRADESPA